MNVGQPQPHQLDDFNGDAPAVEHLFIEVVEIPVVNVGRVAEHFGEGGVTMHLQRTVPGGLHVGGQLVARHTGQRGVRFHARAPFHHPILAPYYRLHRSGRMNHET